MKIGFFFLAIIFIAGCSKKQEEQEAAYSSGYKVVAVASGGTIKGTVKTSADQKFLTAIATQKDQDVCGSSHPNPSSPDLGGGVPNCIIGIENISAGKDFSKKEDSLDQGVCDFHPHVQVVRLGS